MEPYPHGWDVWSNGTKKFMAEKGKRVTTVLVPSQLQDKNKDQTPAQKKGN